MSIDSRRLLRLKETKKNQEITSNQHILLSLVDEAGDGGIISTRLAERLDVSAAAITINVDHLEEKGLVVRRFNRLRRRNVPVCITPRGREVLQLLNATL